MNITGAELPRTSVSGMPRIGARRELKRALESYWAGRVGAEALSAVGAEVRRANWVAGAAAGIDLIASNDFSLYDHVLDAAVLVGAIPARYLPAAGPPGLDTYFAMARGGSVAGVALEPLQLTKWFGTNYHHLVPELGPHTRFAVSSDKAFGELAESAALGIATKPVLLGPLSLLRSSRPDPGFDPLSLLDPLVQVYVEVLERLSEQGAAWVQLDEPILATDLGGADLAALAKVYRRLGEAGQRPRIVFCTSYGHVTPAMGTLVDLPVEGIGLDLCAGPSNVDALAGAGGLGARALFAGVVDGQRPWAADLRTTLAVLESLQDQAAHVVVSTSTSLLHLPVSLEPETNMDREVRSWLAFATEKLHELGVLADGIEHGRAAIAAELEASDEAVRRHERSDLILDPAVRARVSRLGPNDDRRAGTPESRRAAQAARLGLPVLPTTTIGSFPQTAELRAARVARSKMDMDEATYAARLREEVSRVVAMQEELGLDVIVHGEPERDDMVRYFAAQLDGFALTQDGWVQSYGSRCVRPPILFGDVSRPEPMTLEWATYAASLTSRPVKAMLTGPLTMLAWSFPRTDLSRQDVATQLALAISDEVRDLAAAGMAVIQVDEPGLAELVPLRRTECEAYLEWATRAFRLAVAPAAEDVQVHSHMCYAEFGVLLPALARMEMDVLSLEAVRSAMALLGDLASTGSPAQIGPGVYDVHAPRVPEVDELAGLIRRAVSVLGPERVWVNPDCGLKTRSYAEVAPVLANLVSATQLVRAELEAEPAIVVPA